MSLRRPSPRRVPCLEKLEPRQLLASLMVTSLADADNGSLRAAIEAANLDTTTPVVEIDFSKPMTINLTTSLPTIDRPVIINGLSQTTPGGAPGIILDGSQTPTDANGLTIAGGESTVEGLQIKGFGGTAYLSSPIGGRGILLTGAGGDRIVKNQIGNYLGYTTRVGTGNAIGVEVDAPNSTIGGPASLGNIISGNGDTGHQGYAVPYFIEGAGILVDAVAGAVIQGNKIGTDIEGLKPESNGGNGIYLKNAIAPIIGGSVANEGNIISANEADGIYITSGTAPGQESNALILGNIIGLDAAGHSGSEQYVTPGGLQTVSFGNNQNGIDASGDGITIGGTSEGSGNLIASNQFDDISIVAGDSSGATLNTGGGNLIEGNRLGIESDGLIKVYGGVIEAYGPGTIGGTASGAGNVCSSIYAQGYTIQGNLIGTDVSGTTAISDGVVTLRGSNTLGGTTPRSGNLISGKAGTGVAVYASGTDKVVIEGNNIGTDISGTKVLGKYDEGIYIPDSKPFPQTPGTGGGVTIGGALPGAGNVIAGGTVAGISIGDHAFATSYSNYRTSNVLIQGNSIGVDRSGTIPLPNSGDGIDLNSTLTAAIIGGTNPGEGNTIADNGGGGVVQKAGGSPILGNANFGNSPKIFPIVSPSFAKDPAPTLTAAIDQSGQVTLFGTFAAAPGEARTFEFFAGSSPNSAGQVYLGTAEATADFQGRGYLRMTFPKQASGLDLFTATAIYPASASEPFGATSGFSNGVTATAETDPFTDLVVAGSGPTGAENPSSIGTYTFTVTNDGYRPALGVTLSELFPDGGPIQSATTSQGLIVSSSDGNLVGKLGTLAPGESATITFRAGYTGVTGGEYRAETLVTSLTPDVVPRDNALVLSTPVSASAPVLAVADLSLAATVSTRTVSAWTEVTYDLTASNAGTVEAEDPALFYTLPAGSILVSATSSRGRVVIDRGTSTGGIVTAYFGNLPGSSEGKLSIVVRVASSPKGKTLVSQGVIRSASPTGDTAHAYVNQQVKVS